MVEKSILETLAKGNLDDLLIGASLNIEEVIVELQSNNLCPAYFRYLKGKMIYEDISETVSDYMSVKGAEKITDGVIALDGIHANLNRLDFDGVFKQDSSGHDVHGSGYDLQGNVHDVHGGDHDVHGSDHDVHGGDQDVQGSDYDLHGNVHASQDDYNDDSHEHNSHGHDKIYLRFSNIAAITGKLDELRSEYSALDILFNKAISDFASKMKLIHERISNNKISLGEKSGFVLIKDNNPSSAYLAYALSGVACSAFGMNFTTRTRSISGCFDSLDDFYQSRLFKSDQNVDVFTLTHDGALPVRNTVFPMSNIMIERHYSRMLGN